MSHDDTRKVKEILEEAVKDGALQRGSFDLNPILFDLQTAIICAEEIGLNRASKDDMPMQRKWESSRW